MTTLLLLSACNSGNYQAPITDRSEESGRQPVVIVIESDDRPSRYIGASSSVRVANSRSPAIHSVARGESLYSIAFQYDRDFRSIAMTNNLSPPYTIFVGQQLMLDTSTPISTTLIGPEGAIVSAGVMVGNNSIARTQPASNSSSGVSRRAITSAPIPASAALTSVNRTAITTTTASAPISIEPQWQWPVRGRILSGFQANEGAGKGIDIASTDGQFVSAAANGDVVYAGNGIQGSGNLIIIRHNDRFLSAYAQNRTMLVNEGDQIRAGDRIAEVGTNPDGVPTLHFEIRVDGTPVDPIRYLPRF